MNRARSFGIAFCGLVSLASLLAIAPGAQAQSTLEFERSLSRRKLLSYFKPNAAKVKVAFFDADDTLRTAKSGGPSASGPDDVLILPNRAAKLRELNRQGYFVAIVSNQGGIPKRVSLENADLALLRTVALLGEQGATVDYLDFADKWDEDRKPEVGMATRLNEFLKKKFGAGIDWENSFMVGDAAYKKGEVQPDGEPGDDFTNSDRLFAENLKIEFFDAEEYFH